MLETTNSSTVIGMALLRMFICSTLPSFRVRPHVPLTRWCSSHWRALLVSSLRDFPEMREAHGVIDVESVAGMNAGAFLSRMHFVHLAIAHRKRRSFHQGKITP